MSSGNFRFGGHQAGADSRDELTAFSEGLEGPRLFALTPHADVRASRPLCPKSSESSWAVASGLLMFLTLHFGRIASISHRSVALALVFPTPGRQLTKGSSHRTT